MKITDLDVCNRAYKLAVELHKFSLSLPQLLQFDLGDQIRRASRSIPSNIREGVMRDKSPRDKINFIKTALGFNEEIIFNLQFLRDAQLLSLEKWKVFYDEYVIVGKQLTCFMQRLRLSIPKTNKPATS